jgi:microcystin-dependent protein
MSLINKEHDFTTGAVIKATEHNENFDNIYDDYNGNIDNNNIKANAGIVDTKLAQITTTGKVDVSSLSNFAGVIVMWSGAISAIPTGWVICDGNNSTPDLTDRFVIHADSDSGGTNDVGDTGGVSTHALIEAELPDHTHTVNIKGNGTTPGTLISSTNNTADNGNVATSTGSGSGAVHTNRDKFYALAFIMKT